jgi:hypothetical protein
MMKTIKTAVIHITLALLVLGHVWAQSDNIASAQKLDEFGNISADDEMAHLDLFAVALGKDPKARGHIIGYTEQSIPPGSYLMRIFGYRDYLVNQRGIDPARLGITAGGNKEHLSTELWLVPEGAAEPGPVPELKVVAKSPLIFDVAYPDCPPEMTTHLYELKDSLKFYSEGLHRNPNTQGWVIVYPGRRSRSTRVAQTIRDARNGLKEYDISNDRIVTRVRRQRRKCTEVELWIVPRGTAPPMTTSNNSLNRSGDGRCLFAGLKA